MPGQQALADTTKRPTTGTGAPTTSKGQTTITQSQSQSQSQSRFGSLRRDLPARSLGALVLVAVAVPALAGGVGAEDPP